MVFRVELVEHPRLVSFYRALQQHSFLQRRCQEILHVVYLEVIQDGRLWLIFLHLFLLLVLLVFFGVVPGSLVLLLF